MSINEAEMSKEKVKLKDTQKWITGEVDKLKEKDEILLQKLTQLKVEAGGRYSNEYEVMKNVYATSQSQISKYENGLEQPYFSRVDFTDKIYGDEILYIGKFGLVDIDNNEEIVIDWRAPIADLYYSGTQGKSYYETPNGIVEGDLTLKRKFVIKNREIDNAFDEGINEIIIKNNLEDENQLVDEFLKVNLEESAAGKLKDVVATIQKEQNDIIRAKKNSTIVIQGSAGSGKTTIALHRLAYLLYKYKEKLEPDKILVLAPNKIFLNYISEVLPSLGADNVKQMTFEQLAKKILKFKEKIYDKDLKLSNIIEDKVENRNLIEISSKFKGSITFKKVLDRYVMYLERNDECKNHIEIDGIKIFDKSDINRLFYKDLVNLPIKKRKQEIKRYLNGRLKEKIPFVNSRIDLKYNKLINQIKESIPDSEFRRKKLIKLYEDRDNIKGDIKQKIKDKCNEFYSMWDNLNVKQLYQGLFDNEELFNELTENKINPVLFKHMATEIKGNISNKLLDSDDITAMMYLKLKLEGISDEFKFKTMVIDEAQDYSLLQMWIIKQLSINNSMTIVGDVGQGIYSYKGIKDWDEVSNKIFEDDITFIPLTQSYRSTVEIINFANRVLEKQNLSYKPAKPVLRHGYEPEVKEFKDDKEFCSEVNKIVEKVNTIGKKTIAIIAKDIIECEKIGKAMKKFGEHKWQIVKNTDKQMDSDRIIIPSYMTKGLEFDCTILYGCSEDNYKVNDLDKKILYVCLTRALHLEYIFYSGKITQLLNDNNY